MPTRSALRRTTSTLVVIALAALVGFVWHTLGESAAQLRALLPSPNTSAAIAPTRSWPSDAVVTAVPTSDADATLEPEAAEVIVPDVAEEPYPAGPVSGAEFAELLEDGVLTEDDPDAADALRRALSEAAQTE